MPSPGRARYLSLLGARSLQELEDRVVKQVLEALSEVTDAKAVRTRLSKVSKRFQVRPQPEFIEGTHDGEIDFDSRLGLFVIKLCGENDYNRTTRYSNLARLRFTYAHELAHRFFFLPDGERWVRAIEAATSQLGVGEKMKEVVTLGRTEEGLCNNIARRLLIPDDFLKRHCNLTEWFDTGDNFSRLISGTANALGVSRDCLLVRVQNEAAKGRLSLGGPRCIMLVGSTRGAVTRRGQMKLRVITAIMPGSAGGITVRCAHPGLGWEHFGNEALDFAKSRLDQTNRHFGETRLKVRLLGIGEEARAVVMEFNGRWEILNPGGEAQVRRMLLWGTLKPTPRLN